MATIKVEVTYDPKKETLDAWQKKRQRDQSR